jgi:translation initiation factor 2 alpha subunit (eIF-2alpha)
MASKQPEQKQEKIPFNFPTYDVTFLAYDKEDAEKQLKKYLESIEKNNN